MPEAQTDLQCMEELLNEGDIAHIAFAGDEPYVIPINYTYAGGRMLFHCAFKGKKLDRIAADPRVCIAVSSQDGHPSPHAGDICDNAFANVLCWGTASVIEDAEQRAGVLNDFQKRYATDEHPRDTFTAEQAQNCGAVEVVVERMTGRQKSRGEKLAWSWTKE
jgi:hypothetical protein